MKKEVKLMNRAKITHLLAMYNTIRKRCGYLEDCDIDRNEEAKNHTPFVVKDSHCVFFVGTAATITQYLTCYIDSHLDSFYTLKKVEIDNFCNSDVIKNIGIPALQQDGETGVFDAYEDVVPTYCGSADATSTEEYSVIPSYLMKFTDADYDCILTQNEFSLIKYCNN